MNLEKSAASHALLFALGLLVLLFAFAGFIIAVRAQSIEIGPGGVQVNPLPSHHRNWGRTCEELRLACQYKSERGEEGMGNCRRYRDTCQE
jgi:hypothetical protein